MKWWLISDEDVKTIRRRLTSKVALHALDTGLHVTDCVPSDYDTSKQTNIRDSPKIKEETENECCPKCGQTEDHTGEYPCSLCGRPTLWDEKAS